uniref:Uncharacterized protein n=1 Tax=Mus musculus TaxID=10090 RepID=Q3UM67_MOUSE|nr:unnamed protein product [Mus musculus]
MQFMGQGFHYRLIGGSLKEVPFLCSGGDSGITRTACLEAFVDLKQKPERGEWRSPLARPSVSECCSTNPRQAWSLGRKVALPSAEGEGHSQVLSQGKPLLFGSPTLRCLASFYLPLFTYRLSFVAVSYGVFLSLSVQVMNV